jgi:tetratricopeptide (TPR) repeat protein
MITPQPIGIFPLPVNYLVLPDTEQGAEAHAQLMQGKMPAEFPAEWRFFQLASEGQIDRAYQTLADDSSPVARYNRFVLQSSKEDYQTLADELVGDLRQFLDVVAYTLGYIAHAPEVGALEGEAQAFILMAQATQQIEQDDVPAALDLLTQAISAAQTASPVFSALLHSTKLEMQRKHADSHITMIPAFKQVLQTLHRTDLEVAKSEAWLNLGITYQELSNGQRASLLEAVKCYQQALKVFTLEDHPEQYALTQSNLALCYLAIPLVEASDRLRAGIAIQALKEALKVYQRDTHQDQWASTQMNLANAMQYLPTTHPRENLERAVETYEEILQVRNPQTDPIGYARLLANQANALAHLGIFNHAIPKLQQAHSLFMRNKEREAAEATLELLNQIHDRQREVAQTDESS